MPPHTQSSAFWMNIILSIGLSVFVIGSSLWLCLALWYQHPLNTMFTVSLMLLWIVFAIGSLWHYFSQYWWSRKLTVCSYLICFMLSLIFYLSIQPQQNRQWDPEVAEQLHYTRQGDQIQLHNVRNFIWHDQDHYTERWETRRFKLSDIQGVNIVTSYWMGPQIAHTLVSFDLRNHAPLTFSIEIRKEKNEAFSAIGGFFRKYELSLIAADEKDIIFTRSHIRGEQVYFFPTTLSPEMSQALFLEYLNTADRLLAKPKWYNTLSSNCTTLVFDMMQVVTKQQLPLDYRLLASGYLPNYLHDLNALPHNWDMKTWYQKAHINAKMPKRYNISSAAYSELIRSGLKKNNE